MNQAEDSGGRSYTQDREAWPTTPDQLVYHLDLVLELFNRAQRGDSINVLDALLDCVDWRGMFGSEQSGFLAPDDLEELRRYYRARFADVDALYLAEQLSTELMTALMVSGDLVLSDTFKEFGQRQPALWQELRAFFTRKELATALLARADAVPKP